MMDDFNAGRLPGWSFSLDETSLHVRLALDRIVTLDHGLVVVNGPTGSGKTTAIHRLFLDRQLDRPVLVVHDARAPGLDLRALVRSLGDDHAIVLVGDLPHDSSLELALAAAESGHLVVCVLRCGGAAGAIERLIDMGADRRRLLDCLRVSLGQGLVRRLCERCRVLDEPASSALARLGVAEWKLRGPLDRVYRPGRCRECAWTGYAGRRPIYEVLWLDEQIGALVRQQATWQTIDAAARASGLLPLRCDAAIQVLAGVTSVDEALFVTPPP